MDSEKIFELSDTKQLRVTEKVWNGLEQVDLRWWVRWTGASEFCPTKKGIMVEKDKLRSEIMPFLNKLLE